MARRIRKSRAQLERWNHLVACVKLMNQAFNCVRLYPPTHTEVMAAIGKLHETLTPLLEELDDLGFGFMDELLYLEGAVSLEETAANQMLVDRFVKCRVEYLVFMKGLAVADLQAFFQVLNAEATKPSKERPSAILDAKGIKTIHIVEAEVDESASKAKLKRKKTVLDWYEKAVAALGCAQQTLRDGGHLDLNALQRLIDELMATSRSKGIDPFLLIPSVAHGLDKHLSHGVNVAVLCCGLAELHGLNTGQISTLCLAALLHDAGRVIIPVEWTEDHAPLCEPDRAIVRQHPAWGFLLLARDPQILPQHCLLAAGHGSLAAAELPGYAPDVFRKILGVADAYDLGLFSDKHYWKKQAPARVLKHLLARDSDYDPTCSRLLASLVGYFPLGSLVELDDGRRGVVVRPNPINAARPQVHLIDQDATASEGVPVVADLMDLAEGGLRFKRSVARILTPPADLDLGRRLAEKAEFLLSHEL